MSSYGTVDNTVIAKREGDGHSGRNLPLVCGARYHSICDGAQGECASLRRQMMGDAAFVPNIPKLWILKVPEASMATGLTMFSSSSRNKVSSKALTSAAIRLTPCHPRRE